jgi:hypothetical protein
MMLEMFKGLPLTAVRRRGCGLVRQNVLDLLHDLGGDLGEQSHGLAVVLNLSDLGGAENDSADVGVHDTPERIILACYHGPNGDDQTYQARESCATLPPNSSAILVRSRTFWILALPSSLSKALMEPSKKLLLVAKRLSSGMPSLYLPVRRPEARGDQIVVPYLYWS